MYAVRQLASSVLVAATIVASGVIIHLVFADDVDSRKPGPRVTTGELGGRERYVTHVSTDKPIYRPAERVHVRGVLLHHATNRPIPSNSGALGQIEIQGPKGDTVASGFCQLQDSVMGFAWDIPDEQSGGEYTIRLSYPQSGFAPAERKFDIRSYRNPRIKSQIKFLRDGYGPGDEVSATLHAERAEGGIPAGAQVTVVARVDGEEAYRGTIQINEHGDCLTRFPLPPQMERGEGTLAMVIEDGGVVETATKTIPILLQTVDLTFYPEGGDLVAGLSNRVYFQALTPASKPADLAGVVLDSDNREVARFRSQHEGRGRFVFLPHADQEYSVKITEPNGIRTRFELPPIKKRGAVVRATRDVFASNEPVTLNVGASSDLESLVVTISKREDIISRMKLNLKQPAGDSSRLAEFQLKKGEPSGVLTVTVCDEAGRPLAERLVFRQPAERVYVQIIPDKKRFTPGGQAQLKIRTTDQWEKPVPAVVGITVTDDTVLEMIDKREQAPRLPVMALLESDVRELADAHVYLDPTRDNAPRALDLLLGTQGWRRFAFFNTAEFIKQHGSAARRVLAMRTAAERDSRLELFFFDNFSAVEAAVPEDELKRLPRQKAVPQNEPQVVVRDNDAAKNDPAARPAGQSIPAEAVDREATPAKDLLGASSQSSLGRLANQAERMEKLQGRLFAAGDIAAEAEEMMQNEFVAVRVYAHPVRPNRQPGQRSDFTETLYWNAGVATDQRGIGTINFALNDSVTSFRVSVDAFTTSGALGTAITQIESVEPFYVEPKLPTEVTVGDQIQLPVTLVNATSDPLSPARLSTTPNAALSIGELPSAQVLPGNARQRQCLNVKVGSHVGTTELKLAARAGSFQDTVTRVLTIKPQGFPIQLAKGGLIGANQTVSHAVSIPRHVTTGSLQGRLIVYPSPLARLTDALEGLIRQPSGCFEQTSSTVYPLVMAQQYFKSHQGVDPALIERSSQILTSGYTRLVGFECKSGGYEWFGADPGHDALTAYGLMEFTDMAQVHNVDLEMLERTKDWLLSQRDGKGGFARKTHTLHTWLPEPELSSTYNTWALLRSQVDADLTHEVRAAHEAGMQSSNVYVVALAANVLSLAGQQADARLLLDRLAEHQQPDGSVDGGITSVVGSGGQALTIEVTALSTLAWLRDSSDFADNVKHAIKYLAESCQSGRFGSTQSTVLALQAIIAYDQSRARPKAAGSVQLLVDGQSVGAPVHFSEESHGPIELPPLAEHLTAGKHDIQLVMHGGSEMPYSLAVDYHSLTPASSKECQVDLEVALRDNHITEGETTEAHVVVVNRTSEHIPTPIAIIGIPGGLEVRHDQLKELVRADRIAAYEVRGREVVLYWRVLPPGARMELPVSVIAAVPGTYTGPASRAYLYYTDEHKKWVDGVRVHISARSPSE